MTNAALASAIKRLGQLRVAKSKALGARGISAHQLAQFRHREKGAAKLSDYRTLTSYARHRYVITSIDRRWDGLITVTRATRSGSRTPPT